MTRDDLFKINADIAKGLVSACAKFCPEAILLMIVNPVNSVVPAMCELYKKKGLDAKKIVGVTTLDIVRANKFVGEITGKNPGFINVPVIGGHAGTTILPVFSQDKVARTIEAEKIAALDKRVQDAGTEVVNAKDAKEVQLCPWRTQEPAWRDPFLRASVAGSATNVLMLHPTWWRACRTSRRR